MMAYSCGHSCGHRPKVEPNKCYVFLIFMFILLYFQFNVVYFQFNVEIVFHVRAFMSYSYYTKYSMKPLELSLKYIEATPEHILATYINSLN